MTEADISQPMTTKAQLCAYNIINGSNTLYPFFAGVNTQQEIEVHRGALTEKHKLDSDHKIEFVIRKPSGLLLYG